MNLSLMTLGELLSSKNETIKRNALSVLKQLQKERDEEITQFKKTADTCNCGMLPFFHLKQDDCK